MPQTEKVINPELKAMCKRLMDKEDLMEIAREQGCSISYVYYIITGERYNKDLIEALKNACYKKVDELAKAVEAFKLKEVNPQEIDN